jgi:predicted nucleic acid-binding protein
VSRFVLDASVTLAWFFEDEASAYAAAVLESLHDHAACVPQLWALEIVNVLRAAERRGRCNEARSHRFLALLNALPIQFLQQPTDGSPAELLSLARQHALSAYDASYLALALHEGLPLATQDQALMRAAESSGVGVWAADR